MLRHTQQARYQTCSAARWLTSSLMAARSCATWPCSATASAYMAARVERSSARSASSDSSVLWPKHDASAFGM